MNAHLGGFSAALIDDPVWVTNVVPTEAKINTLGAIYERGLIGTYQGWCEAMSTYPRTYDLIHADSVLTLYKDRLATSTSYWRLLRRIASSHLFAPKRIAAHEPGR